MSDAAADGDAGRLLSVEQAFEEYRHRLARFLRRRLQNDQDAEDVLQETYVRLLRSYRDELDGRTAANLIFRIATNLANDLGRRRRTHRDSDHCSLNTISLASAEPSQERRLAAREELDALYDAIASLPPRRRQVFLLHRVDRMTYPEIASHCGISVKAVEKHITKALRALRAEARVGDRS